MSRKLLSEVAEIKQGYQFRKKVENIPDGLIKVVQMADVINGKKIDYDNLVRTEDRGFKSEHFLKKGDILFCARGLNNYALLIDDDIQNTIAVSQFFIIRTKKSLILPDYLVWYLAQPEAVAYFRTHTLISTVPLINKKSLENIEIPVPPISTQENISRIYRLKEREKYLIEQIADKKEMLVNSILRKSIKNRS